MNTWYALREFETRDITSRSYQNRHALELNAREAREITSNFIQAREYFRSASEADFTVRPLLQYYGVVSLSRGLTLFLEPTKREATLKQSHGLQVCDWGKELSNGLRGIGNLRIRVTKGVFEDLLIATENRCYFRHHDSVVNMSIGANIPPPDSEFVIEEVAARIPEVSEQYHAWTGKRLPFLVPSSIIVDNANSFIKYILSAKEEQKVDIVFPRESFPSRTLTMDKDDLVVQCNVKEVPFTAQRVGFFNLGQIVLYGPPESNLYFSPLVACFILSFALGMLCRYFPTTWINIGRAEKGDAFLPLAIRLLDWIEDSFPAMVVDILRGPYDFESK